MLRRHVWVDPALLTSRRIREQQRLARHPGARFASVVLAAEAPPRSRKEMETLAWVADQLSVIPGRLGLHQEFGALLTRQLLENGVSAG